MAFQRVCPIYFEAHNEREKEKEVEHNMSIDPSSNVKDCGSQKH